MTKDDDKNKGNDSQDNPIFDEKFRKAQEELINELSDVIGDPMDILTDPSAVFQRLFQNPDALKKIDKHFREPEFQKTFKEISNSDIMQDIIDANPQFANLISKKRTNTPPKSNDTPENAEQSNEPTINFLIPPYGQTPWNFPINNYTPLKTLLKHLDNNAYDKLFALAEQRIFNNLTFIYRNKLNDIAEDNHIDPVDLMMQLAAFAGDFAYHATQKSPENLTSLAKYALAKTKELTSFPATSYPIQLIIYLDAFDAIDEDDWMNLAWILSANPVNNIDGFYKISQQELEILLELLPLNCKNDELLTVIAIALLQWNLVDLSTLHKPLEKLLASLEPHRHDNFLKYLQDLLEEKKLLQLKIKALSKPLASAIFDVFWKIKKLEGTIPAALTWNLSTAMNCHVTLLQHIDMLWNTIDTNLIEKYINYILQDAPLNLKTYAVNIAAAWEPQKYDAIKDKLTKN